MHPAFHTVRCPLNFQCPVRTLGAFIAQPSVAGDWIWGPRNQYSPMPYGNQFWVFSSLFSWPTQHHRSNDVSKTSNECSPGDKSVELSSSFFWNAKDIKTNKVVLIFHWGFQRARLAPPSWNFQPMRLVCFKPSQASSTPGWPKTRSTKSPVECFGFNCYHHNIWSIFFVWDWCNFYQWYPITLHMIFQVYGIYTNDTNPVPQHITVFTLGLMQIASMVSNYRVTLHMILFVLGLMQTTSIVSKYIPP